MNIDRLTSFVQSLVRTPSLSGEEKNIVALILAEMRAVGFDRAFADANGSAIGILQGARPGKTLLLDAPRWHCRRLAMDARAVRGGNRKWIHLWTRDGRHERCARGDDSRRGER